MHEIIQRRVCRVGFVGLCLLPTVVVLAWGASRALPGHPRQHETRLRAMLGLEVALDDVLHPRPGVLLYHGLELADPQSGALLLRCRLLEVDCAGQRVVLTASQPEIEAERSARLWELLLRRLRHELVPSDTEVQLLAGELTWRGSESSQTFTDLVGRIGETALGDEARIDFRLAGANMDQPASLRVVRDRQTAEPTLGFSLSTGTARLSCSLFAPLVCGQQWLGPRGRFEGFVWADRTADGWQGEITGHLSEVDLDRLVTSRFPHLLSGLAEVRIERARFRHGRLEEAVGAIVAGPGQVGRSLIAAGSEVLQLGQDTAPLPVTNVVAYQRLAADFAIDPSGVQLKGRCPQQPGAILVDATQTLWREPSGGPQPVVSLLRMLVPHSEVQVPATREADWLIRHLPVPEIVHRPGSPGAGQLLPEAHLRFGGRLKD